MRLKSESALVNAVCVYVKKLGCKVPSPNYLESNSYAPQWRVFGGVLEYKLPSSHGSLVIARLTRSGAHSTTFEFDVKGLRE